VEINLENYFREGLLLNTYYWVDDDGVWLTQHNFQNIYSYTDSFSDILLIWKEGVAPSLYFSDFATPSLNLIVTTPPDLELLR